MEGEHYSLLPHPNYTATHSNGHAQVTGLSGPFFTGNFLTPLAIGQTVRATESVRTPLAGAAIFTYSSETDRPVGACPVPPPAPPPPPPPAIPALQGTILRLTRTTISKLLRSGWHTQVTINQPGRVIEDLYLQDGTLPAYASRKAKHHAKKPAALLLARGSTLTKSAGKVDVLIKVTKQGRRRLKHAARVKAVLITTLVSTSGAKLDLRTSLGLTSPVVSPAYFKAPNCACTHGRRSRGHGGARGAHYFASESCYPVGARQRSRFQ